MEFPRTREEINRYEKTILDDHSGNGTIFTGDYYHLDYQPSRESEYTLKCNGIELVIRRNSDQNAHDFWIRIVPFKTSSGWFAEKFLGIDTRPFQDRLKSAIDKRIEEIKQKEIHMLEVDETAKHIVKCQMRIDDTVAKVAGTPVKTFKETKQLEGFNHHDRS